MSQIREAILEIVSDITGLSKEEVESKKPLRDLLDNADNLKGKEKKYCFGIFTFCWPKRTKDGQVLPFLGIRFDWKKLEEWEDLTFPTHQSAPDTVDVEYSLNGDLPQRFLCKLAQRREKAAAKAAAKTVPATKKRGIVLPRREETVPASIGA